MRRSIVLSIAVILVTLCCSGALAQSVGGYLPGFAASAIRVQSPSLNAAWTTGWTRFSVDFSELPYLFSRGSLSGTPNSKTQSFKYPTNGAWFSLVVPLKMTESVGFRGEAGLLVPATNQNASLFVDNDTTNPGFPYAYTQSIATRSRWWTLDGRVDFNLSGYGTIVGGVRWDYFDTRVFDFPALTLLANPAAPPPAQFGIQVTVPGMEGDILFESLAPYLGLEVSSGAPYGFVTARAIGFPWIKTWLNGRQTQGGFSYGPGPLPSPNGNISDRYEINMNSKRGYFYELGLEYKARGFLGGEWGAFVKWTQFHANFDGTVDLITYRIVPAPTAPDVGATFPAPSVVMDRRYFVIGGTLSIPFNFPI
jgi:hypothetical protein